MIHTGSCLEIFLYLFINVYLLPLSRALSLRNVEREGACRNWAPGSPWLERGKGAMDRELGSTY